MSKSASEKILNDLLEILDNQKGTLEEQRNRHTKGVERAVVRILEILTEEAQSNVPR